MSNKTEQSQNMEIDARIEAGYWLPQYSTYKIMRTTSYSSTLILVIAAVLVSLYFPADVVRVPRLLILIIYSISLCLPPLVYMQRKEVPKRYAEGENTYTGKAAVRFSIFNLTIFIAAAIYFSVALITK